MRPYWNAADSAEATAIAPLVDPKTKAPVANVPAVQEFFFVIYRSRIFMFCTSKDPNNVKPLAAILAKAMAEIPGAYGMASQRSLFGRNMGRSNSVTIEVVGVDMNRLRASAAYLQRKLGEAFSVTAISADPQNYDESGPEVRIVIDQVRAKELKINVQQLAVAVRAMVDGAYIGDFDFQGNKIDLILLRDPAIPINPNQVRDIPTAVEDDGGNMSGAPVGRTRPLRGGQCVQQIRRVEQQLRDSTDGESAG